MPYTISNRIIGNLKLIYTRGETQHQLLTSNPGVIAVQTLNTSTPSIWKVGSLARNDITFKHKHKKKT